LLNKIKEVEFIQELNLSRGKIKDNFNKSFVSIFNDTDYFDSEEKQNAFRLFLKKIKSMKKLLFGLFLGATMVSCAQMKEVKEL